ncbi:hypothetical protein SNE40_015149 [Patella caerulea]|uniref:Uncharacterized protein n=1 Tax=Patella caerulea TaxID=87958 RepID=A0AAN8JMM4_PATCE
MAVAVILSHINTLLYILASWMTTAQNMVQYTSNLTDISVFTQDRLQVRLDVQVKYRPNLFERNTMVDPQLDPDSYQMIVNATSIDAIKGTSLNFSVLDYFQQRDVVEAAFKDAIDLRFAGVCCGFGCNNRNRGCKEGCKSRDTCTTNDKGVFTLLDEFKLVEIHIPDVVRERILQVLAKTTTTATP